MTCYIIRHGQDDETIRGGWSNHSLVPEGVAQVHTLGAAMTAKNLKISRIYSSDIQRARETALILQQYLQCPVEFNPGFRESNNGHLAGMKHEEAERKYPGIYWNTLEYTQCWPGGESPEQFFNRVRKAWLDLKNSLKGREEDVLLVTHGGVLEAILCIEQGLPFTNQKKHFQTPCATLFSVKIEET